MKLLRKCFFLLIIPIIVTLALACGKEVKKEIDVISEPEGIAVGASAPDFDAPATTGENLKLADLKGSWAVLFFYPKAFTGG